VTTPRSVLAAARAEAQPLSLQRCLETFTAEEVIPEGYCSKCKALREARTCMGLWRLPPVLVIQLKRFQYTAYRCAGAVQRPSVCIDDVSVTGRSSSARPVA
jgi:ubiquitin C-terminal hydrolase